MPCEDMGASAVLSELGHGSNLCPAPAAAALSSGAELQDLQSSHLVKEILSLVL